MKTQEKKKPKETDRKVLSFFLIMFPTVIIVSMGMLNPIGWIMIVLAIYQSIMLKQFLDNYYDPLKQ